MLSAVAQERPNHYRRRCAQLQARIAPAHLVSLAFSSSARGRRACVASSRRFCHSAPGMKARTGALRHLVAIRVSRSIPCLRQRSSDCPNARSNRCVQLRAQCPQPLPSGCHPVLRGRPCRLEHHERSSPQLWSVVSRGLARAASEAQSSQWTDWYLVAKPRLSLLNFPHPGAVSYPSINSEVWENCWSRYRAPFVFDRFRPYWPTSFRFGG